MMSDMPFQLNEKYARLAPENAVAPIQLIDPNEARNLDTEHVFHLTFQNWERSVVIETRTGGNCQGFENLDGAISNVYEALPENAHGYPYLVLNGPNGGSSIVDDNSMGTGPLDEDTLKDLLVSAQIVALVPKEKEED